MMESPSEGSTRGQSLSGLDGRDVVDDDDTLTTLIGTSGLRGGFSPLVRPRWTTCPSGSGDQQLSDSQHPITTVTRADQQRQHYVDLGVACAQTPTSSKFKFTARSKDEHAA
jgi:hypothetical protein